jgi:hypothetical protein
MKGRVITIFGTAKAAPADPVLATAERAGKALAEKGFVIANGGYGGTMLAGARGAAQAGGKVIGVTCSAFKRSSANEYVTQEIVTASLQERLAKLIELGAGFIVLAGGTGTLLELAQVWEMKNKGFAGADKQIIIVGPFWQRLVDMIAKIDAESINCLQTVETAKGAVEYLSGFFKNERTI